MRFEGLGFHFGLVGAPFRQHAERCLRLAALMISAQAAYAAGVVGGTSWACIAIAANHFEGTTHEHTAADNVEYDFIIFL